MKEGAVGNKYFGEIAFDTALIMGSTQGNEKGIGALFDYPLPWNSPKNAAEWDFSQLSALYMDPLNYGYFTSQPWLLPLYNKIKQFVIDGGTIYITADSNLFVQNLSSAAGAGLQFYTKAQVPVYYGAAGLNKIMLKGALREAVGVDELVIPFMPYEDGSGGPVFRDIGKATPLATAEITLFSNGTASVMRYPVAVSFPLGKGMVYYSSFPIPLNLDTVTTGLSEAQMPAVREFAGWFMSKPIANASRVRMAEAHGINNEDIGNREDTTVDNAKSRGLPLEFPASGDLTVVVGIDETVLGKVDYSTIPVDYAKNRSWSVSLIGPGGQIFETKTTSGDIAAFQVASKDHTGGTWRVKLNSATGYLDKQIVVAMTVDGLKELGGGTVVDPGNEVAVTGITLAPTSADLKVGDEKQLTATVLPENATNKNVTWSTSDNAIATVDTTGKIKALAAGTATIRALTADGNFSADCVVRVSNAIISITGITLTPASLELAQDATGTLNVIFAPTNATNKNVSWTTSNASVATVSNGTVTAKGEGTATITATTEDGGKTAVSTVTVTKSGGGVDPKDPKQEHYEAKYPGKNVIIAEDGGSQAEGTSGDDVIVGGDGDDWLEGGEGDDIYVYELGGGHDTISNVSTLEGDRNELHFGPGITSADLTFDRNDNDLVIGIVSGDVEGSVTIEDWYLEEKNKLSKIVFDDGTELTTEQIEALADKQVPFVPVTGVALSPASADLAPGATFQLAVTISPADATSKDVTWSTSNPTVATVDLDGKVTAGTIGTATIRVLTLDGSHSADCVVTVKVDVVGVTGVQVSPATLSLTVGSTGTLTATVAPENATNKTLNWSTSDALVATVDATGRVTAASLGSATITATTEDGNKTATCAVTVTNAVTLVTGVQISPTALTVQEEQTGTLTAVITPENATNKTVTWSTSDASVATVDDAGAVTGRRIGSATISAVTADGNKKSVAYVTVTKKTWTSEEEYYENKYPGKDVVILPGGGTSGGGSGNTVVVGGDGDDWTDLTDGDNVFVYNPGGGHDTVSNAGDRNEVHFGLGIWPEDLVFSRNGDDLVVSTLDWTGGYSGSVTAESWYLANENRLAGFAFSDGTGLTAPEAEELAAQVTRELKGDNYGNTLRTSSVDGENVIVYGNGGNDALYGGTGRDRFIPGTGNDTVYARSNAEGGGQKVFVWTPGGAMTVHYYNADHQDGDGRGILRFPDGVNPENVEARNSGNNVVFAVSLPSGSGSVTFAGANVEDIRYHLDAIHFSDGTGWKWNAVVGSKVVRGDNYGNTLRASSLPGERVTVYGLGGNDAIYGGAGDDTFIPGSGNNTVYARSNVSGEGGGRKTFVWNVGDGNTTVHYYNVDRVPNDGMGILRFGPGIGPENVEARNSGNNVVFVVTVGSSTGNITFVDANKGDICYQLDEIQFADGTVWKWSDIVGRKVVRGDNYGNTLRASSVPGDKVTVYGLGGNDSIYGGAGEDTFIPGSGNNTVYARSNVSGEGGGKKTFVWNIGDGNITAYYYNADREVDDGMGILQFGPGIGPENVEARNSGNNVVFVVTVGNSTGNITFVDANKADIRYQLDAVQFADDITWKWSDIVGNKVVRGDNYGNTLRASSLPGEKITVYGLGGNDVIYGGAGDDTFVPGSGNNTIYARLETEGGGKKTFVWNVGDGNSTVYYDNADRVAGDGPAILKFGPGVGPENVEARNSGNNVVFVVSVEGSGTGNITFMNANLADTRYQLDEVQFDDGMVWKWSEIAGNKVVRGDSANNTLRASSLPGEKVTVYGLGGNDSIYGGAGTDIFVPGPGSDTIYARSSVSGEGGGRKIFVWNPGDGSDTIHYYNTDLKAGTVRFGSGVRPEDAEVRNSGENAVIALLDTSGGMTFVGGNRTDAEYHPARIVFADKTVWRWRDILGRKVVRGDNYGNTLRAASLPGEKVTVYGLGGNDVIYGGAGDDTFVAGSGSDTIYARSNAEGGGKKTFVWNIGDGNTTVHYYNETHEPGDGMGILRFGADITPEDVEARNNGGNVIFVVSTANGGGQTTFVGANTADIRYHLDEVQFLDGTVWMWEDITNRKVVRGDNYGNTLRASSLPGEKVTVYGLGGNDVIYGGAGDDTFVPGSGSNTVYARSNEEGGGNKTFVWDVGDGHVTVHYYRQPGDGMGVLRYGSGVDSGNVMVKNSGNNVVFSCGGYNITFVGANTADTGYHLDEICFSDGEAWTWSTMPRQ